jgi:hypothetical protein
MPTMYVATGTVYSSRLRVDRVSEGPLAKNVIILGPPWTTVRQRNFGLHSAWARPFSDVDKIALSTKSCCKFSVIMIVSRSHNVISQPVFRYE